MNYLVKRLATLGFIILFVSMITFIAFQIIPGDPVLSKLGMEADEAQIEALRKELGLDRPVFLRFFDWLTKALQGDLGISLRFEQPVAQLIANRLRVTAVLTIIALLLVIAIGIPLGILIARKENVSGLLISITTQLGMAIPSFWLGIVITYIFGLTFKLFTPGRYIALAENLRGALTYLLFAAIAIAVPKIAVIARYTRNAIIEQKNRDYVRTALSKGCSRGYLLYKHVLRNALIPVITVLGMITADVLGGSLIIEQVFNIPGIGRLLIMGITTRDLPLVQGIVFYVAIIVVLINFIVDVLYQIIDPRIKLVKR